MSKKETIKPYCDGEWTEAKFVAFVKSQLRNASMRWPPKHRVMTEARVARGVYLCAGCGQHVPATIKSEKHSGREKNVFCDHRIPIIDETGFESWDSFIEGLFCDSDNLQVLCGHCHNDIKTPQERLLKNRYAKTIAEVRKNHESTYNTWANMNDRCHNPKATGYKYYGANGIEVCDRWKRGGGRVEAILNFIDDMGHRPEGKTLDRIDYTKGYYKENCRWASCVEQARNTSQNNWIEYNGELKILEEWAEELGVKSNSILTRLRRGWTIPQALGFESRDRPAYTGRLTQEDFIFIKNSLAEGRTKTWIGEQLEIDGSVVSRLSDRFNLNPNKKEREENNEL